MQIRIPPPGASVATAPDESGKLHAPSAARNAADICEVIKAVAPASGHALEIASGTGQHIKAFAAAMPAIQWHPTEVSQARLVSIAAYIAESDLPNVSKPQTLNATQEGWGDAVAPKDLIVLINLLHLISEAEVVTLVVEAARALCPAGQLFLYGPFKRNGELTSDGDAAFDASIRASDPEMGYKDDVWVKKVTQQAGLAHIRSHEMPANNLGLVFQKP